MTRFRSFMKAKRLAHGLSIKELAGKIGLSYASIAQMEAGNKGVYHLHPRWDEAVARALPSVSVEDLRLLREADATDRAAVRAAKARERVPSHEREAREILQDAMIVARSRRQA